MASTYENDLRLEEMATGENSGSWGTKTNNNLELVADAFSYGTEIIANADTAITIADGVADAARSLALKITSSENLTTTRVITLGPNTVSKVWIIENSTSGGQILTISAGSGSNITLANGTTKIIATDGIGAGSNVVELTQDLAIADLSVDGILSLADGTNSAPSLTNTGDTNTGLYFPAADEVGITVGGTQVFKADSTGVDITGTINGDDIILSDADAPSITLTDTTNTLTTLIQSGNSTAIIGTTTDHDLRIQRNGSDIIDVLSNGIDITGGGVGVQITGANTSTGVNNALRFKDTDTGVVADQVIGRIEMETADASNPGVNLQIDGIYGGSGAGSELVIKTGVAGSLENRLFIQDAATIVNDDAGDNDFVVRTSNSSATFYINGQYDGVGIHSSSPTSYANAQAVLYIEDNTNPALGISDTGQARDWWIVGFGDGLGIRYADGSNTGSASNTVPAMFFKNTGFVGVGDTGAPLAGLHLSDGTNAGSPQNASRAATLMIDAGATASADLQFMVRQGYNSHIFFGDASDPNVGMMYYDHSANHMNFVVNTSTALTIDDQGDVGIGNTDPTSRLVIEKESARTNDAENMIRIVHNTSGTSAVGFGSKILFAGERSNGTLQNMGRIGFVADVNTASNLSSALILEPASNGTPFEGMRISSSGNVGIGEQDPDSTLQLSNSSSVPSFTLGRTPYSSHGNLTIGGTGTGHITSNIDEAGDSTVNVRASRVAVGNGEIEIQNSPQTAVGSARTFTTRLRVDEYGGLTIASVNATAAVFGGTNVVNGITAVPSPAGTPFVLGRDTGTTRSAHFGGNLKFDSGYGIDFSATGDGTGTVSSELLDDYEEGTWTPVVYDTNTSGHVLTLNSIIGKYKKIGSWVNCTLQVGRNDATSLSGVITITNLPFTVAAQGSVTGGTFWLDNSSSDRIGVIYVVPSADRFYLLSDHAVNNYLLMSEWQNSRPIYLQVSYNSA